jgi:hypothetical protein
MNRVEQFQRVVTQSGHYTIPKYLIHEFDKDWDDFDLNVPELESKWETYKTVSRPVYNFSPEKIEEFIFYIPRSKDNSFTESRNNPDIEFSHFLEIWDPYLVSQVEHAKPIEKLYRKFYTFKLNGTIYSFFVPLNVEKDFIENHQAYIEGIITLETFFGKFLKYRLFNGKVY